jgi:hypothetical protein
MEWLRNEGSGERSKRYRGKDALDLDIRSCILYMMMLAGFKSTLADRVSLRCHAPLSGERVGHC